MSEPVDGLYRLCEVLYNVAVLYFEAKQNHQETSRQVQHQNQGRGQAGDAAAGSDFEAYLNQAGLLPMDDATLHAMGFGFQSEAPDPTATGVDPQASQAADWYHGYMNMVGWSELSPSSWPR